MSFEDSERRDEEGVGAGRGGLQLGEYQRPRQIAVAEVGFGDREELEVGVRTSTKRSGPGVASWVPM